MVAIRPHLVNRSCGSSLSSCSFGHGEAYSRLASGFGRMAKETPESYVRQDSRVHLEPNRDSGRRKENGARGKNGTAARQQEDRQERGLHHPSSDVLEKIIVGPEGTPGCRCQPGCQNQCRHELTALDSLVNSGEHALGDSARHGRAAIISDEHENDD